jgi:protein-L-isoaspartate(D-aspartate) O-methyltransferase
MLTLAPTFDGRRTIPSAEVTKLIGAMLNLTSMDKLLEIGTGSGFQTQFWADTGAEVHSIELEPFVDTSVLTGDCIYLHSGDGKNGIPEQAPFTAIVASAAVEEIPSAWSEQLAEEGRMVLPIGDGACQKLTLFEKHKNELIPIRIGAYVRFQRLR